MASDDIHKRAEQLIRTSIDDCRSSLQFLKARDLPVLKAAVGLELASLFCRATMVKMLEAKIRQLEKTA